MVEEKLIYDGYVKIYDRYKGIVDTKELTYTINMHNVYPNGDGYITDMWD